MRVTVVAVIVLGLALAACEGDAEPEPAPAAELDGAVAAVSGVAGPSGAVGAPGGLTVRGEGRVSGEPDVLRVTVGVEHRAAEASEAIAAMERDVDAVLEALREQGVADEDLQTAQLSIHPDYGMDGPPETTPGAYRAVNLVEARVRDVDRIGAVLDTVLEAGGQATRIEGVGFALEDNAALLELAREEALDDARRRAEHYAEVAGATLGPLEAVAEVASDLPRSLSGADDAMESAGVPVALGEQQVGVSVEVRWQLEEN